MERGQWFHLPVPTKQQSLLEHITGTIRGWGPTHASSETWNQPITSFLLLILSHRPREHTWRKALSGLFWICDLTDAHDCLVLPWLTEFAIPSHVESTARYSPVAQFHVPKHTKKKAYLWVECIINYNTFSGRCQSSCIFVFIYTTNSKHPKSIHW